MEEKAEKKPATGMMSPSCIIVDDPINGPHPLTSAQRQVVYDWAARNKTRIHQMRDIREDLVSFLLVSPKYRQAVVYQARASLLLKLASLERQTS